MPDASATRIARIGLGAKIFIAATLSVAGVLGVTLGLTSLQANRTADESIRRALAGVRRGVQAFLAGRTATFAGMSAVSAEVPQFRERLLKAAERSNVLDQAEEHRRLLGAAWVLITDEHGVLVARTDYPTESDIDLSRGALIAGALSGDETSGAWVDERRRKLFMAVAVPLRTIGFSLALGLLLALASAYVLARQIAGPIRRLALATRRVQDGDYSVEIGVPSGDEIGMLSQAFQSLVADLKEKAKLVEYMMATSGAAPTEQLKSTRPSIGAATGSGLRPGTLFANRYEVKEVLGMGGMGVVYRAFDRELQEAVAIKALRPEALVGSGVALERFKQEIRLARKITHRNVVRTYDLGEVNGMYYLTMEYVEGTSLKQLINTRGPLPVSVTLTIGKQLCRALEVAHEQGVIHRDIQPQNMVVEPSGVLKVMDFGIARLANRSKDEGLTRDGMSIGTPDYMSPEHLSGKELDARSDLYSAGVVLFECLPRRLPFDAETTFALIAKHLEEEPPDPRTVNPDVPEALAQLILKAMAKEPADRYQTAVQMHDALAAIG